MTIATPTIVSTTPRSSAKTQLQKVTTPGTNPLLFKDSNDRQAAVLAKAQRIQASPAYGKLRPEQQRNLLGRYYDETVRPAYASSKMAPPEKDVWLGGITKKGFKPEDYYYGTSKRQALNTLAGAESISSEIFRGTLNAGVWVSEQATKIQLGLAQHFAAPQVVHQMELNSEEHHKWLRANIDKISSDTLNSSQFWTQTHPSKTIVGRVDSMIGENIIELPLYGALAEGRLALPGAKTLTAGLRGSSKLTNIVVKTLGDASDAFMSSMLEGKSKQETLGNMASWMGFGAVGHVAGATLMKSHTAKVAAMGGKPLIDAITNEAEHELETGKIGGQIVDASDKLHEYLQRAHQEDPIKTGLVTSRKVILNSISQSNFGKAFKELSTSEKSKVRSLHDLVTADAIREMPVHVPEIAKANAENTVQSDIKINPLLAKQHEMLKQQFGIDAAQLLQQAEADKVARQTGIKNNQGVVRQIAISGDMGKAKKHYPQAVQISKKVETGLNDILKLPPDIKGSNPRYGYGNKLFSLDFEDPRDLAAYTVAQGKKNKAHDRFMDFLAPHFDNEKAAIRHGQRVREHIKSLAKDGDPNIGPLNIESQMNEESAEY